MAGEPIQPGRRLGVCPECGGDLRRDGNRLCCRSCPWSQNAGTADVDLGGADTEQQIETVVEAVCAAHVVVRHAGLVWLSTPGGLVDLAGEDAGLQLADRVICRMGRDRGPAPRELTKRVVARLRGDTRVPACRLVTPNPVLYRNHAGDLVPTRQGFNACGVVQLGPDVVPRDSGAWTEFLENTTFVEDRDRRTYEAWCLAAVVPLEYLIAPMLLVHATEQNAGKTWLIRSLAWALGFRAPKPLRVTNGRLGEDFDRRVVEAAKGCRLIEIDNVTGSDDVPFEDNRLSDVLTKTELSCSALYRVGTETVENRCLVAMSMNLGTIVEDLAVRTISVRLNFDPEDPRIAWRARRGETHWMRPEVGREVLAEVLWRAQRGWAERPEQVAGAPKYQEYFNLVKRLTGHEVPPCHDDLRFGGAVTDAELEAAMGDKLWPIKELAAHLAALPGGAGPLVTAARRGPRQLGRLLAALRRMGRRLKFVRTKLERCWQFCR